MGVIEFLCDRRFHQSYVLPPNPETGRRTPCRISYADYGDPNSDAVVLFCGALMGMRLCYSPLDQLAKAYNIRIIHPDRPGVGGSDPVELHERISMWLEMVPRLLSHLNISHVSIASHSGGAIYALNTMLMYPNLLHPQNPYVCFFAPWVHHSHSKVKQLRATELLPAPLIGRFASLARFVNDNVVPLAGMSSGFLQGLKGTLNQSTPAPAPVPLTPFTTTLSRTDSIASRGEHPGLALNDPDVVEELRKEILAYLFAECMDGISADAQLFLKKPHTLSWCSPSMLWSDTDDFVLLLSKLISEEGTGKESRTWTIDAFHAEDDNMIGEKGKQWFDNCWQPEKPSTASAHSTETPPVRYEFRSKVVKGTDHNYLMDPAFGVSEVWLERVRASWDAS
ncbi:hypothetical protein BU26DRAFT_435448 [Trematosphaeria pertusa]|uniref:AB hydrolase-1 domain-containing protein n=1 Tax=Trematosphaeria pertusa TaxID=390896 RepID=A0A6A6I2H1_9PLEO|nr:uncharacterized protein BU26DRAFT_435448 [Trematosphaeria pertusa]KAF2244486.1 hypothetical protein BU26DRAFT_435448 [Trematosphaeria pertusa]